MIPADLIYRRRINKPVSFVLALALLVGSGTGWRVLCVNLEYLNLSLLDPLMQGFQGK